MTAPAKLASSREEEEVALIVGVYAPERERRGKVVTVQGGELLGLGPLPGPG
jgi:hypothetical protein